MTLKPKQHQCLAIRGAGEQTLCRAILLLSQADWESRPSRRSKVCCTPAAGAKRCRHLIKVAVIESFRRGPILTASGRFESSGSAIYECQPAGAGKQNVVSTSEGLQ